MVKLQTTGKHRTIRGSTIAHLPGPSPRFGPPAMPLRFRPRHNSSTGHLPWDLHTAHRAQNWRGILAKALRSQFFSESASTKLHAAKVAALPRCRLTTCIYSYAPNTSSPTTEARWSGRGRLHPHLPGQLPSTSGFGIFARQGGFVIAECWLTPSGCRRARPL